MCDRYVKSEYYIDKIMWTGRHADRKPAIDERLPPFVVISSRSPTVEVACTLAVSYGLCP